MTNPTAQIFLDIAVVMLVTLGVVLTILGTLIVIRDFRDDLMSRRRPNPDHDTHDSFPS